MLPKVKILHRIKVRHIVKCDNSLNNSNLEINNIDKVINLYTKYLIYNLFINNF